MGDTNLDNLQPITSFMLDGIRYEKMEDGRIEHTSSRATLEVGGDLEYYNTVYQQLKAIQFFRDHQDEFANVVRSSNGGNPVCTDVQTLLRNFASGSYINSRDRRFVQVVYMFQMQDFEIIVGDEDNNGKFDYLQVKGPHNSEFILLEGSNDFNPLISALLEVGVAACTNMQNSEPAESTPTP